MDRLMQGYARFLSDVYPKEKPTFDRLAGEQHPIALVITCSDSRVIPQQILQCQPGDIFLCRNPGNMVPAYGELLGGVSATIEYAVLALDVPNIIVLGHSDCGAMHGVLHPENVTDMPTVASWLRHGDAARRIVKENYPNLAEPKMIDVLIAENVLAQLENLRTHPSVAARLARGQMTLHAWIFQISTGRLHAFDVERGRFLEMDGVTRLPYATSRPRRVVSV
jgi:carbonic anhydrase